MTETKLEWHSTRAKPKSDKVVLGIEESLSGDLKYVLCYYFDNVWWDKEYNLQARIKYWTPLPDIETIK